MTIHLTGTMLSALPVFEAAARTGSFTRAANEVHITTGAVSQQMRQLEAQLSLTLFKRHSRGIALTPEGVELYEVVQRSLQDIGNTLARLRNSWHQEGAVRLKLTPSFAFKWLVPRLQQFYREYPHIQVQTFAEGALVDSSQQNYDLAIDYGQRPYPQSGAELLLEEKIVPVMTPGFLQQFDCKRAADWEQAVLLHDAMPWLHASADEEWRYWFDCNDLGKIDSNRGHFFNRTDMAMAAAEAGLGIALARTALVAEDFRRGVLVSPCEPIDAGSGYYLLQARHSPAIDDFRGWLIAQLGL